ncbi:MAG: Type 1 glutamine amidotransferase-like domain-containing protein [Candidatus Pacebacteria bacterium]|jgi:dipeptidase E|nr:Type 1 glutamine amidotransferase-like domain-containing protein [Candidatus Paceibacterota bacterium]
MKLLLTSSGISNPSIAKALFDLVAKKPEDTSIVVIPTAANVEQGDKEWFINDLINLKNLGFKKIAIADISAVGIDIWKPQLEESDILFFEGGNTYHLMEWINKSGLKDLLPTLLETRVYVGVSAGSMVTNKDLMLKTSQAIYGEDMDKDKNMDALGYVDFYVLPHLNNEYFANVRKEKIEAAAKDFSSTIYALDDNSAIKVVDGNIEIVTEGEYLVFN